MNKSQKNDVVELKGRLKASDIRALKSLGHIERLSITKSPLLTSRIAQAFTALESVSDLWLWCDVTRTAMRSIVGIHGLKTLDVLSITAPGKLENFSNAKSLEIIRANHYMSKEDLLEVAKCKSLRVLGAQNATLTPRVLKALLRLPKLESLDLEATNFDDEMAKQVHASGRLKSLDVGATEITRNGLMYLCRMRELRSLDIWATRIEEPDLELLWQLPKLEYLSIGGIESGARFNAETLLPRLAGIRALQRVWLDGIVVTHKQERMLKSRYSTVRVTLPDREEE